MRLPEQIHGANPNWLLDLLAGLYDYPDSLLAAWHKAHDPVSESDSPRADSETHLPWYRYSPDTELLLEIRNLLSARMAMDTARKGHKPKPDIIYPPETPRPEKTYSTGSYASFLATYGG